MSVHKICSKSPNSIKFKLWDKSFFNTIMINMIVIPIWQMHTHNTPKASLTSSSINLAMPKCENTFFVPKNV